MTEPAFKTCSVCKQEKPFGNFKLTKAHGKTYRRAWCNNCLREYFRKRFRKLNAEGRGTKELTEREAMEKL